MSKPVSHIKTRVIHCQYRSCLSFQILLLHVWTLVRSHTTISNGESSKRPVCGSASISFLKAQTCNNKVWYVHWNQWQQWYGLGFSWTGVSIDIQTGFRTAFRHFWSFVVSPLRRTSHVEKGIPQNLGGKHCTRAPYKTPSRKQSTLGQNSFQYRRTETSDTSWHVRGLIIRP